MSLSTPRIGFLGLGVMGLPMALNLARHYPLTAWNRSASKNAPITQAGGTISPTPSAVLANSDIIFSMLFDGPALQSLFDTSFTTALHGKILINTSSVPVECNVSLAAQVHAAGGSFFEMPVSGSRGPAEQGQLVGMLAGDEALAQKILPIVKPMTRAAIYCGEIGQGLRMKYAVNLYLITMMGGLAEAMNLAQAQGLDVGAFGKVLDAGPMASDYSRHKVGKMLRGDWTAEAAVKDCFNLTRLISDASDEAGTSSPIIDLVGELYGRAKEMGLEGEDMSALMKVFSRLK
ncbi:putative NAD binding NADP oxidoreductase coenzyme F420-dependent [Aspergillus varians]